MKKKNFFATLLIVGPFILFLLTIIGYIVLTFVMTAGSLDASKGIMRVLSIILGIFGIASLAGIPITVPYGIYLIVKSMNEEDEDPQQESQLLA